METIVGYVGKELTVRYEPSLIDWVFGGRTKITVYVNVGQYWPTSDIKWVDSKTGEDRKCEYFDNYVMAQKMIKESKN